jgi:bifunctional enzyme CysN/CysC
MTSKSPEMPLVSGGTVLNSSILSVMKPAAKRCFRFPVQDIYKFTEWSDDRRIMAGTVYTGKIKVGEEVIFLPKKTDAHQKHRVQRVARQEACGRSDRFYHRDTALYQTRRADGAASGSNRRELRFKATFFWMGRRRL